MNYVEIELQSGRSLAIKSIMLYESRELSNIASIRSSAAQKLKGLGDITVWGTPTAMIGGALALGGLEKVIGSKSEGAKLLDEANTRRKQILKNGVVVPIYKIENIDVPSPAFWTAHDEITRELDPLQMTTKEIVDFEIKQPWLEKPKPETKTYTAEMIHSGESFLGVETHEGFEYIFWEKVVSYSVR